MTDFTSARVGIVFGTDTGNTEEMANRLATLFEQRGVVADVFNVTDASVAALESFDLLILGIPTWDFGGIQCDWEDFEESLRQANLSDTVVAMYGLGDQFGYGDYFVDALGWLNERILATGAEVIGAWSTEGYDFTASRAANADKSRFCGLAIDDDQQFELTDERLARWTEQLVEEFQTVTADA